MSETGPSYWYFNKKTPYELKHRYNFKKSELVEVLKSPNPLLSEWENMKNNGYDRIWDCGYLKYEMTIK